MAKGSRINVFIIRVRNERRKRPLQRFHVHALLFDLDRIIKTCLFSSLHTGADV